MTKTTNAATNINDYRKAGGKPGSLWNQRICGKLVHREIVCCLSMLVSHFAEHQDALEGSGHDYDEVLDLCRNSDWETAADAWINDAESGRLAEITGDDSTGEDVPSLEDLRHAVKELASEDYEDFCREQDIDPEENEVYEHWAVSSHFADKLKEQGETVGELFNLHIWGRCCTGQAISMDHVIQAIAARMEILDGQRNAWTE